MHLSVLCSAHIYEFPGYPERNSGCCPCTASGTRSAGLATCQMCFSDATARKTHRRSGRLHAPRLTMTRSRSHTWADSRNWCKFPVDVRDRIAPQCKLFEKIIAHRVSPNFSICGIKLHRCTVIYFLTNLENISSLVCKL